ncbi:MAG: hypothetical protein J0L61_11060 [Planctomycetes bacterium]|nr:hypothetical protein [Planctomycetota bacterium]
MRRAPDPQRLVYAHVYALVTPALAHRARRIARFAAYPQVVMPKPVKAETLLAELNRLRQDLDKDPSDLEWLTLHHVFCFVSYKLGDFQKYVDEQAAKGAFEEFEG